MKAMVAGVAVDALLGAGGPDQVKPAWSLVFRLLQPATGAHPVHVPP